MIDDKGFMFDTRLLKILCCPDTRKALKMADDAMLSRVNQAIEKGCVKNASGEKINEVLEEALVVEDETRLYIIREGIPVLLSDEAILLPLEEK